MNTSRSRSKPRNVRQSLSQYEPGAHLWADFGAQWKAGVASLIPFGVVFFTTQPVAQAMTALASGGYTVGPGIIGVVSLAWAGMSMILLHRLRFHDRRALHYGVYAVVGALTLLVVAMIAIALVNGVREGSYSPADSSAFVHMLIGAPLVGAAGSVIGRWVLDSSIHWHIWIERKPLPDVFTFVPGKRDRDEFERM